MEFKSKCQHFDGGQCKSPFDMSQLATFTNSVVRLKPLGAGFSYAPFPVVHSVYDSAKDLYEFLQTFVETFPEYASNSLAVNSLSYGG